MEFKVSILVILFSKVYNSLIIIMAYFLFVLEDSIIEFGLFIELLVYFRQVEVVFNSF
jgi:hypothetical protein